MEYIIKNCPKCNGELPVPSNLETCICMFCGATVNFHENDKNADIVGSPQKLEAQYQDALGKISILIENYTPKLKEFKKSKYSISYEDYVQNCMTVMEPIANYANLSEECAATAVSKTVKALFAVISTELKDQKKGNINTGKVDQLRFFLALYTVPMIVSLKSGISDTLAEQIVQEWKKQFPKYAFNKGNYEDIQNGFQRKGLCFITSAVCETMDKSDDCYELTQFRKFRDQYVLQSEAGRELVKEYYQIAPVIVSLVNVIPERRQKYEEIWSRYLKPCLEELEANSLEECENKYINMVKELKSEFEID